MKEPTLKNFWNYRTKFDKCITIALACFLVINLTSCKSVGKAIGDPEVYLYEGQAGMMDGTYFIDPYRNVGNYKLLTEVFNLKEATNSNKVDFKFLDDEHLEITYTDRLAKYTKVIKGKMKNGGFRYEYRNFPIGIPLILFAYQFKVHYIALGNDDNIVITEYQYVHNQFFLKDFSSTTENRYYFDRQLK